MATCAPFQTQLASIMEVLVKAAVSEISKLVDDKCAFLHLEIARTQGENEMLRRKLLAAEDNNAQRQRGLGNYSDRSADVGSSCPHPTGNTKFTDADDTAGSLTIKEEDPEEALWARNAGETIGHALQYSNTSAERRHLEEPRRLASAELTNQGNRFNSSMHNNNTRHHGVEYPADLQLTIKTEKEEGRSQLSRGRCQHGPTQGKQGQPLGEFALDDRESQLWSSIIEGDDIESGFLDFSSVVEEYSSTFPEHSDTQTQFSADDGNPASHGLRCRSPARGLCNGAYTDEFQDQKEALQASGAFQDRQKDPAFPQRHPQGPDVHSERDSAATASLDRATHPLDCVHHKPFSAPSRGYICALCGKAFGRLHQFRLHQQSHKRKRAFWCAVCGKSFQCSSHLSIHHRTHTGEKPYGCGQCGKRFTQQSSLRVHQRTHSGERPYSCAQCGKTFILMHHLKRHRIIHTYS